MRKIIIQILALTIPLIGSSQNVLFDIVSEKSITVTQGNSFSTRIIVHHSGIEIFDEIIKPGAYKTIPFKYSKAQFQKLKYTAIYDDLAYQQDVNYLDDIKEARDRNRASWGVIKGIGKFIDEAYFGGKFSTLFEVGNYGRMLFNGASEEEWAESLKESAIGFGINKSLDSDLQRGVAHSTYELAKSIQAREYQDLQDWLVYYMQVRESKYRIDNKVIAVLPSKEPVKDPYFGVSISYPFYQNFQEKVSSSEYESASYSDPINAIPISIGLNYGFLHLDYSQTKLFSNIDNDKLKYLKPRNAIQFKTYSAGLGFASNYFSLGFGASYLSQQNYSNDGTSGDFKYIDNSFKVGGYMQAGLNLNISNHLAVFSDYRITVFNGNTNEDALFLQTAKAGIVIKLKKRVLDFSG